MGPFESFLERLGESVSCSVSTQHLQHVYWRGIPGVAQLSAHPGITLAEEISLAGGAAGTLIRATRLDVPIDYRSASRGVSPGAGGF